MKRILPRALFLVLFFLFIVLATSGCNLADLTVLWPPSGNSNITPTFGGVHRRVISVDGRDLEIWIAPAQQRKREGYVLRFYGNAARADWSIVGDAMQFSNLEFWGVNYPGYGGSRGPATLRGVAAGALAAYDVLAEEARRDQTPIFVMGTSLGTTAALHVAAERGQGVSGIVLENPPPLKKLIVGEYGWWNLWFVAAAAAIQVPDALDSEWNAKRCSMPALFISAERDEVVPTDYQRRVIDAYAGKKEVIVVPNGTHNGGIPLETEQKVTATVQRMIASARAR